MTRRENWGSRDLIEISNAELIQKNFDHYDKRFTVSKDDSHIRVNLGGRDKDHLQELADEINFVMDFDIGDIVNLTVAPYDWELGEKHGTKYFLVSIQRSNNGPDG